MYDCPGCEGGIEMCKRQPCRPTPEEAIKLVVLYADNFRVSGNYLYDTYVEHILPRERQDFSCVFLKNNLCSIQDMKPWEGRAACCKIDNYNSYKHILKLWDTDEGRRVVHEFRSRTRSSDP